MAKQGGVAARVEQLVLPALEGLSLRLWEVRFEKEGPEWYLRVLIDRADGAPMDTDTCEAASRAIDPLLDEVDPVEDSYFLEVGSPGLGRKLTRPEHFSRFIGHKVEAGLYKKDALGRKVLAGKLLQYQEGQAVLEIDGEAHTIAEKDAAWFKLCDDEGLFD